MKQIISFLVNFIFTNSCNIFAIYSYDNACKLRRMVRLCFLQEQLVTQLDVLHAHLTIFNKESGPGAFSVILGTR